MASKSTPGWVGGLQAGFGVMGVFGAMYLGRADGYWTTVYALSILVIGAVGLSYLTVFPPRPRRPARPEDDVEDDRPRRRGKPRPRSAVRDDDDGPLRTHDRPAGTDEPPALARRVRQADADPPPLARRPRRGGEDPPAIARRPRPE